MADWDADATAYGAELASRRGAGTPATLGEIWNADWQASGLDTLTGSGEPLAKSFNELVDAATAKFGPVPQAARDRGLDYFGAPGFAGKAQVISQMVGTLPKEEQDRFAPLLDVRSRAADAAAKIEADAADVAGRTYGLSGHATSWLASIARQVVDPVNIGLIAAGGPEAVGVSGLARQALVAGFGQAIQEPVIQNNRSALGLESGLGRAVEDVGQVAGGAVALPLLFRAGAWALRNTAGRLPSMRIGEAPPPAAELEARATPDAVAAEPETPARMTFYHGTPSDLVSPADLDAAALLADRDRVVAHAEPASLEAVTDALERGRALMGDLQNNMPMALPVVNEHHLALIAEEEGLRTRSGELDRELAATPAGDPAAAERLARVQAIEGELGEAKNAADRRTLSARRDELLAGTTPEDLRAAAAPLEIRRRLEAERTATAARLEEIAAARRELAPKEAPPNIGQVVAVPKHLTGELPAPPKAMPQIEGGRVTIFHGLPPDVIEGREIPDAGEALSRRPTGLKPKAPAEPPEKPPAEGEAAAAPTAPIGNPQLAADAGRALEEVGDFKIELGEGTAARSVSARQALEEAREDAAAARELEECIGGIEEAA